MANDFDIDATELVETYGQYNLVSRDKYILLTAQCNCPSDFLMKYIIIGMTHRIQTTTILSKLHVYQGKPEQANRVSSISSLTTPVRVKSPSYRRLVPLIFLVVKEHSQHTIGVEFSSRTVKLGEKRIKLQVCFTVLRCYPVLTCSIVVGYRRSGEVQVSTS